MDGLPNSSRRYLCIAFSLVLFLSGSYVLAADSVQKEDLSLLVSAALANNPELKASEARWQMFKNRIAQARSLDDPMLSAGLRNMVVTDPVNFRRDPMTQKAVGLSQQVPFWGKRDLKGEIATREAESYQWQLEERKLELVRLVKESYYRLYFIGQSSRIVEKNIRILNIFISVAEAKYSVNQAAQTDIFKAQLERSRMLEMRITLEQQRRSEQAALNALLYRPPETPIGEVPDFSIRPVLLSEKELVTQAYESRPQIKNLAAQIDKGKAALKLANKEFYPDFNVSAEYMQREPIMGTGGEDMYSVGVSINLPVQRARRHAMVAEANSGIRMASEELNTLKNSINSGISDLMAQIERRKNLVELYNRGIIPQAEQTLQSASINYQVNKVDFLTLLDSFITLFNYQREYYDSLSDYQIKFAQLEALVGRELP